MLSLTKDMASSAARAVRRRQVVEVYAAERWQRGRAAKRGLSSQNARGATLLMSSLSRRPAACAFTSFRPVHSLFRPALHPLSSALVSLCHFSVCLCARRRGGRGERGWPGSGPKKGGRSMYDVVSSHQPPFTTSSTDAHLRDPAGRRLFFFSSVASYKVPHTYAVVLLGYIYVATYLILSKSMYIQLSEDLLPTFRLHEVRTFPLVSCPVTDTSFTNSGLNCKDCITGLMRAHQLL